MKSMLLRFLALLLALLLCCGCCLAEEEKTFSWDFADGTLVVSVVTTTEEAAGWSSSVSEKDMLLLLRDEYEETDSQTGSGTWVTSWSPGADAAGIVELNMACRSNGSDEPAASYVMELYLDGAGAMTVLSLNGEEVAMLPVD